jgi:SnoaL-like protein
VNAYEELRRLVQGYARAADDRDIGRLTELFHPEANIAGARGTQVFNEWIETMKAPRTFPISMHVLGDPLIELAASSEQATLDTYAVVYQLSDPGSGDGDLTLGIRYLDEAVRYEGRWVIKRREAKNLWMR